MLTTEEYSKCAGEMQEIWKTYLRTLEYRAAQAAINGDKESLNGEVVYGREYIQAKSVVERCINIIAKYTKGYGG